jgi:UDP-N-acetylglucosamine 2-epimerase
MASLRNYNVFVSHAWSYDSDYHRIVQWLDDAPSFIWNNLSVPEHDPIAATEKLKAALNNQMRPAHVFLILSGMYVTHSGWIQYEINFARRIGRPVIGICPWGSSMVPTSVQNGATEIVGWNSANIIRAIRQHALS